jgi:purine catabolism regulator
MAVVHRDSLVALIPILEGLDDQGRQSQPIEQTASVLHADLVRQLGGREILVGIGRQAPELREVHLSYSDACRALRAARGLGLGGGVVTAESLGFYGLLFREDAPLEMRAFVERTLGRLVHDDSVRGSDYLATLSAYLNANCNIRAAARDLHVHANTLIHRLKRIEEVAGLDLDKADTRLQVHVALKVHELERRFGGEAPGSRGR